MTAAIVPRWEWRTFGDPLGEAEDRLATIEPERVEETDELYLLSSGGGDTVKVRRGSLDVKHLERVGPGGLELWKPVVKTGFPLDAAVVTSVLARLNVTPPALARGAYALEELLDVVVHPRDDLLAVSVHKRRERRALRGCLTEVTEVRTASATTRTIAVESEDPSDVLTVVRELGLEARPNVSFPRGLRALLGFGLPRFAVVDVGTNSVKFLVAEREADGSWRTVVDRAEVTRLGEGLQGAGVLSPEAMERTAEAVAGMVDEARRDDAVEIAAVGTAGLRIARNGSAFVDLVAARCGVDVEVVTGQEEGRLAFLATTSALGSVAGSLVVFDTGGGSSQFTFGHDATVDEQFSVNVGAARFTEQFGLDGPVSKEVLSRALGAIAGDLDRLDGRPEPDALFGMGGAVTNLASVAHELRTYDPEVVQGTVLEGAEIDRQIELYRTSAAEERRHVVGLQPNRAEVILAGACIVRTVLEKLGRSSLVVSDRGLRHRLLAERFGVDAVRTKPRGGST